MKTGAYVRVKRGSVFENVEITELSDTELDTFFFGMEPRMLTRWAIMLAGWIRDNVADVSTERETTE